jgi:hypothetical protein
MKMRLSGFNRRDASNRYAGVVTTCVLVLSAGTTARAGVVDVSYTVSGSPGDWIYDFSVTNNIDLNNVSPGTGPAGIWKFAIEPPLSVVSSPTNWPSAGAYYSSPSVTNYYESWQYNPAPLLGDAVGILAGQTLSGFEVMDVGSTALTSIGWTVYATGGLYYGPDNLFAIYEPVFAGTASPVAAATPLPASLPLFAMGLGAMGCFGWRRKQKHAAAAVVLC